MKKLLCMLLAIAMLLPTLAGCGSDSATTSADTTAPATTPNTTAGTTPETPTVTTPGTTAESKPRGPETELPEGERVVKKNYTAVLNDEVWSGGSADTSAFDMAGTGVDIYQKVNVEYKDYTRTFVLVENGTETEYTGSKAFSALKKLGVCGANVTLDETAKTAVVKIMPVVTQALASWKAVTAKAGAYIRFEFTANLATTFCVTVTAEENGQYSKSLYTHEGIEVKADGSSYVGMGQATVPFVAGKTYYVNICLDGAGYPILDSFPLNVIESDYDTSHFQAIFRKDWTYVNDERYMDQIAEHFYTVYPRLYARWGGTGKEPMQIFIDAERSYDGVAAASGTRIFYSVNNLNGGNPAKCGGAFTHEMTHLVQKFNIGTLDWFGEAMANYGRHRYWSYDYSYDCVEEKTVQGAINWNYSPYGDGQLFFTWMDWVYPTIDKNNDGKRTPDEYGLLDYIVFQAKAWTGTKAGDNPTKEGTALNNWVKEKTGFATIDLLRQEYVRQLKSGEFVFKGFRDFKDNFVTENLPGVPSPNYLMHEKIEPVAKTNPILAAAMTTGDNLCIGAHIHRAVSEGVRENISACLIDGNLDTRYQAQKSTNMYKLAGVSNEVVIDLGSKKVFDTYTLICYASKDSQIANTWEIFVSVDGGEYTPVDYQTNNTKTTVSVTFDEVSARYVKIRLYEPDSNKTGVTRLAEFMLFDSKQ